MKISLAMLMMVALATASGAQQSPTRATSGDSAFARKAAQANMAEVELGTLALQKSTQDEVKKFAQMIVDDYSKALDELKGLAGSKKLTLPTEIDAQSASDAELKSWAAKTLPTIEAHLKQAETLNHSLHSGSSTN
jgi:putative membrane protein